MSHIITSPVLTNTFFTKFLDFFLYIFLHFVIYIFSSVLNKMQERDVFDVLSEISRTSKISECLL